MTWRLLFKYYSVSLSNSALRDVQAMLEEGKINLMNGKSINKPTPVISPMSCIVPYEGGNECVHLGVVFPSKLIGIGADTHL